MFAFDPNSASKADFLRLGLNERTANAILNYRSKGGRFRAAEDFKKIYTLSPEDYARLNPYIDIAETASKKAGDRPAPEKAPAPKNFPFDPNTASKDELLELGLSEKVVHTILSYRSKGGTFRKKTDLKKIFGMTESDYERLAPFIQLPEESMPPIASNPRPSDAPASPAYTKKLDKPIDINTASEADWQSVRGIGPAYSRRIVGFREKLGGFYSVEQVAETYNLPDSVFQKIKPLLAIGSTDTKKININAIEAEELQKHPYIDWKRANAIINYRKMHGDYTSVEDVQKVQNIPPELYEKMRHYLKVGE